jgi:acetolactate synthase-1/2/3 large subunit
MTVSSPLRTGADILADALLANGADLMFGVPGESYLAFLESTYHRPGLRFINARQEGGAAYMADAYGKLTGKPGICVVTRGPGACNASPGIHTAYQDSTPMIVLIGQVPRDHKEREAFQEIDYTHMFGPMAKWVVEVQSADRMAEHISHAYHLAQSGRPGPVVVVLPEDVLVETSDAPDLPAAKHVRAAPGAQDMADVMQALQDAQAPLCILGGPGWSAQAKADLEGFAARMNLPVVTTVRCQDYFDNNHPCYAGDLGIVANPTVVQAVKDADLLLVIGARLGEMTTQGYTAPAAPKAAQTLVHVVPDAADLGRVYSPDLPMVSDTSLFAQALAAQDVAPQPEARVQDLHAQYQATMTPIPQPGALDMGKVMTALNAKLPEDTIVTNGAGNYAGWIHKHRPFRAYRSQLAPTNGSMGYGVPAAAAAALVHPDRKVVTFAGDGCFQMNGQELGTMMQYGLNPLVIVVNNGIYGTIRMHQEREYPTHVSGTDLVNPDFALLAKAYGFHAEVLDDSAQIEAVLDRALAVDGPALIECRIDPDSLAPRLTINAVRDAALKRQG